MESAWTSGASAAAASAPGSPGSCSAATSTRRTRSSRCRRRCSRPARSAGFFAVPYTIVLYPIIFVFMARLWSVSHRHGYVTPADFVRGPLRLARAVAGGRGHRHPRDDALHRAAARRHPGGARGHRASAAAATPSPRTCRCSSPSRCWRPTPTPAGCARPALIAFVKDALIYLVIIVAVIYLPHKVGGWGHIFDAAQAKMAKTNPATGKPTGAFIPSSPAVLGLRARSPSARRWRCSCTRTRSRRRCRPRAATRSGATPRSCRRTRFVLGLLALLGWVAIAAGTKPIGLDGKPNAAAGHPAAVRGHVPDAGSPASPSRPSPSARSCRPRSCRSPRRTRSPATSTASGSSRTPRRAQEAKVSKLVSLRGEGRSRWSSC